MTKAINKGTIELRQTIMNHGKIVMNEIADRFSEFAGLVEDMKMSDRFLTPANTELYEVEIRVRKIKPKKKGK